MSSQVASAQSSRVARVLIAEDHADLRALLESTLRDDGFEVDAVEDGRALLDRLADNLATESEPYDLVVSDIHMPGFTALDVLVGLRPVLERMPFILITAFGDEKTHERARVLGASAIFEKPFDMDDLRRAVRNLICGSPIPADESGPAP